MAFTPEEWFANIPKVTRYWMMAMLAALFLASMGLVSMSSLVFTVADMKKLQARCQLP